jgi:hypothetical protein
MDIGSSVGTPLLTTATRNVDYIGNCIDQELYPLQRVLLIMRGITVIMSLLIVGCSNSHSHTGKSALIGGGSGLAVGALAGSGTGALVGGPIGALGGAAVGAMTAPHARRTMRSSGEGASRSP